MKIVQFPRLALTLIFAVFTVCACAAAPVSPPPASAAPAAPAAAAEGEAPAAAIANEYRIGPGDVLNVFIFNQPELSVTVPVRPDGLISTPLVENMGAAGKTPSELGRDVEKRLADFVRTPKVNIIVTNFVGIYGDQIRVVGQAAHPQALPYRNGMTLLDVMIAVGGLAEFAAGNRARLVRNHDGKSVEMKVRLQDLLNSGDIKANVPVQPGDVLIIPQSRF
ncbi:MAG: XrtA/PEP-CTERM system exopolysaccharide export protein [Gammaproteobacteria bacterium]